MKKKVLKYFGMGGHNCRDVVDKLEELIDGEVDEHTQQRLITEIKRCPACLEHYHLDKAFKDFLQTKTHRKCCASEVKQSILQRIRAIDEEEEAS